MVVDLNENEQTELYQVFFKINAAFDFYHSKLVCLLIVISCLWEILTNDKKF